MEAIWMIIFVLAIVFQAISKISGSKGKLPQQWERARQPGQGHTMKGPKEDAGGLPPVLKDWGFPWGDQWGETLPPDEFSQDENRESERPEVIAVTGDIPPNEVVKPDSLNERDNSEYRPVLSFNSGDIVNGLIFSELLQPPKCKRKR